MAQEAAPVGLVTADVERIDFTIEKLHSLWASVVELAIGIFLLQIEVGWACIAPVIVAISQYIYISSRIPKYTLISTDTPSQFVLLQLLTSLNYYQAVRGNGTSPFSSVYL